MTTSFVRASTPDKKDGKQSKRSILLDLYDVLRPLPGPLSRVCIHQIAVADYCNACAQIESDDEQKELGAK